MKKKGEQAVVIETTPAGRPVVWSCPGLTSEEAWATVTLWRRYGISCSVGSSTSTTSGRALEPERLVHGERTP